NYLFDDLRPGDYAIQVVRPVGYVFSPRDSGADASDSDVNRTTGQTANTTLSPGEDDLTWDAGLVVDASIGNFVWSDLDDNGEQDGGEPGVSGITVRLLDNLGNVVSTTTTDGSGFYLFDFLTPADYAVEFVAPTGYSLARRDQGGNDAADSDPHRFTGRAINTTLSPGEDDLTWDAGLVLSATIGDRVWDDANQNGAQDGGELGVSGVTVRLLDSTGTAVLTTTTDASGNYLFDPVPPDDYHVEFVLPAGYVFTLADQGGNDATDSDADITNGRTILTSLSPDEDDMTWDAGLITAASIGDKVWRDNDSDGVQDAGEPGVSGVTVRLLDSGGAVVSTTTTDASGNYAFTNLRPGYYAIEVMLPTGYQFSPQDAAAATDATDSDVNITTGRTINTTLIPGENDITWDAGLVPLANIGNRVWRDNNNNGRQDGGEPGVNGITVNLLDSGGAVIRTTTTVTGAYSFTNLPPGTYSVEFVLPATGFQFSPRDAAVATDATDSDADTTTGRTIPTVLDPGETDNTWDAGLVPRASIGNYVWQDTNGNGQQNGGEPGISGVTVNLLNSSGTVINTTTTSAAGAYSFTNLPPGTYAVEFVLPATHIFTTQDSSVATDSTDSDADRTTGRTINTVLSPGENDMIWDAGMVLPASLGNYVWLDANDNGVQDGGESGVPNVTVRLLNTSFAVLATTTTDAGGNYLLNNLIPGSYIVEFVPPAGHVIARLDQGGNDATDSDANRTTGRTITKNLAMGENDLTWDAGLVQVASIGDRVWIDINNNGVQDGGENGLGSVTVQLRDSGGTVVATTTTDASGNYSFTNLTPADYSIRVVLPAGYQFSPQDAAAATDATDSDVNTTTGISATTTLGSGVNDLTWDAGLVPLASIGDRVWVDINDNGVQDGGEVGLATVTVQLRDSGGALVTSTTTDATGNYLFNNLPPATYSVQVVLPTGYQFSPQDAAAATDATDSDVDTATGRTINTILDPDEDDMTWDAGLVPQTTIGDRVWIDANDNGVQDGGETGLVNVTVRLLNSSGTVINTTTTDAVGNYSFTNLPPGTYAIEFVPPAGYVISQRDQGGNDAADSDADLTTGRTVNT
ncbi:MAG: carboxypeptidase regulatory-like domain-containing protein, partial [Anaerolineae bacterium]|nr:carboxypeptidase regulatory-like domain-containing protein [Anaerolineae bacterium]